MARREHSETELTRKLRQRGFAHADIQSAVATLADEKLVSNTRFIESYIHHRRTKGLGPLRIRAELSMRGIAEELIEHHLNITDNAWLIEIKEVWQKRFKNVRPADYAERAKHMRFLQYRGFTPEQIDSLFR